MKKNILHVTITERVEKHLQILLYGMDLTCFHVELKQAFALVSTGKGLTQMLEVEM